MAEETIMLQSIAFVCYIIFTIQVGNEKSIAKIILKYTCIYSERKLGLNILIVYVLLTILRNCYQLV